jgi:hypothetical protein
MIQLPVLQDDFAVWSRTESKLSLPSAAIFPSCVPVFLRHPLASEKDSQIHVKREQEEKGLVWGEEESDVLRREAVVGLV